MAELTLGNLVGCLSEKRNRRKRGIPRYGGVTLAGSQPSSAQVCSWCRRRGPWEGQPRCPLHNLLCGNRSSAVSLGRMWFCFIWTALHTWDMSVKHNYLFRIPSWLLTAHSLFLPMFIMLLEASVWSLAFFGLVPPCSDLLTNRLGLILFVSNNQLV